MAAVNFCEQVQDGIDVYIIHGKYLFHLHGFQLPVLLS